MNYLMVKLMDVIKMETLLTGNIVWEQAVRDALQVLLQALFDQSDPYRLCRNERVRGDTIKKTPNFKRVFLLE